MPYLHEMFDRNVLWTLKKFPELVYPTPLTDHNALIDRQRKVFEATKVSNHLAMFHVYFLKVFASIHSISNFQSTLVDLKACRWHKFVNCLTFVMVDQHTV